MRGYLISTFIGEVGRWFSRPGIPTSRRRPEGSSLISSSSIAITSPAAPDQTVHAVLRHTAFRHRSSQCMRSRVAHRPGEPVASRGLPASPM